MKSSIGRRTQLGAENLRPAAKLAFFLPTLTPNGKIVVVDEKSCADIAAPNDAKDYLSVVSSPSKPAGWQCDAVLGVSIHARCRFGRLKLLKGYFSVGLRVLELVVRLIPLCRQYDVVVSFQIPTVTLALGIATHLLGRNRPRFVVRELILWAGNQGLPPNGFKLAFLRLLLRKADLFFCCSRGECLTYPPMLRRSMELFAFLPLPAMTQSVPDVRTTEGEFVIAAGRTGRDYGILLEAVKELSIPLKLICSPENLRGLTIGKFTDVHYDISEEDLLAFLQEARFVIIPLKGSDCSAGQRVVVSAMMYGKAVIMTRTPGSEDYVKDGQTGLLVEPGNVDQLRAGILRLWNHPALALAMGQDGRYFAAHELTPESWARTFWSRLRQIAPTNSGHLKDRL